MKKIEAIFAEEKLETVKTELEKAGFVAMTIDYVKDRGPEGGILLEWRAGPYKVDFLPKILLMLVVEPIDCPRVIDIIQNACREDEDENSIIDGSNELGRIFVSHIDTVIPIVRSQTNPV